MRNFMIVCISFFRNLPVYFKEGYRIVVTQKKYELKRFSTDSRLVIEGNGVLIQWETSGIIGAKIVGRQWVPASGSAVYFPTRDQPFFKLKLFRFGFIHTVQIQFVLVALSAHQIGVGKIKTQTSNHIAQQVGRHLHKSPIQQNVVPRTISIQPKHQNLSILRPKPRLQLSDTELRNDLNSTNTFSAS